jgi:hypothetical protein
MLYVYFVLNFICFYLLYFAIVHFIIFIHIEYFYILWFGEDLLNANKDMIDMKHSLCGTIAIGDRILVSGCNFT